MDRYLASHWQDSTFNFDPRWHAYLWLYPHLFAAFKRLKLHDPFNVAYECWVFLIGMFVFSFSYWICKYVHSALQQSTMNRKRTGWSTIGCSQRDPIANDRTHLFVYDGRVICQTILARWIRELTDFFTLFSIVAIFVILAFAFCLHLCFLRRWVAIAVKKNATFFIPEKWRRQRYGGFRTSNKCWKPWKLRTRNQTF